MALAAALIALCCAQPSIALPGQDIGTSTKAGSLTRDQCAGRKITVQKAGPFVERVWRLIYWKRHEPKPSTVRAYRNKLRCAGPGHHKALKHRWRKAKREFYRHRHEVRELIALAPYPFGEPTLPRVAIPPYVVRCETQGFYGASRWGAVNPSSGARGPYQLLPSTYYGVCSSCDWSHLDQNRAAREVWDRSGGSEWACA